jgi:hypothetical protein
MRKSLIKTSLLTLLLAVGSGVKSNAQHVILDGTATAKVYQGLTTNPGGTAIADLTGDPSYPDSPTKTETANFLEYPKGGDNGTPPPGDVMNSYGLSITGFIKVDQTGDYVFWMSSDDNGEFWLSTDDTVANLAEINHEPVWNPVRSWLGDSSGGRDDTAPENVSAPIHLEVGKKYAFQGLEKEGGGGDNFAVTARLATDLPPPDGTIPLFNSTVSANVAITKQPANAFISAGNTATFSVSSTPAFYQWFKGASAIPGATSSSFTTAPVTAADNGTKYSVKVTGLDGSSVTSTEVTLAVVPTRNYTQGALNFYVWTGAPDIATVYSYLGTPIGSFSAGGGTDPDVTNVVSAMDSRIVYGDDSHEGYTGIMVGDFIPDQTGTYYFHIKSDDPGQLFFNKNGAAIPDPNADVDGDGTLDFLVANETACCNDFAPAGNVKTGGPFTLTAGQKYGILGIWHEIGGGDYLQVAFTRDGVVTGLDESDGRNSSTIPGQYLAALQGFTAIDLAISTQPVDTHVEDKRTGTFTVATTAAPGVTYQWQSAAFGSTTFTNIAGATSASLTVPGNLTLDNKTQFRVQVKAEGQSLTSSIASLLVDPDVTPPKLAAAYTAPALDAVVVSFNEPVTTVGAAFALTGGATVSSVEVASSTVVVLHLAAPLTPKTSYTISATGVKDLTANVLTNTLAFTSGAKFTPPAGSFVSGLAKNEYFYDINTTMAAPPTGFLNADAFVAASLATNLPVPDVSAEVSTFLSNTADWSDPNYGDIHYTGRLSTWFTPPQTGNYVFFAGSDDQGALFLSTDSDPANVKKIAAVTAWDNRGDWTVSGGGSDLNAKRSDKYTGTQWPGGNTITLVGGEKYYIEMVYQETGGGDHGEATFKLEGQPDPANGTGSIALKGNLIGDYLDVSASAPIVSSLTAGPIVFSKGDKITLTADAVGKTPLAYQWYQNKAAIAGATSASYVINSADYKDIGDYAVKVSNDVGTTWSAPSGDPEKAGAGDDSLRLIMKGAFLIEDEDFNFGGGKHEPVADVMPYLGNAYLGLTHAATEDVDFNNSADQSGAAAFAYTRFNVTDAAVAEMKGPGDNVDSALGRLRGSFSVTNNYAVGWTDAGDWQNYTRTFPQGKYAVIGGFAHDGVADGDVGFNLSKVANPTIADGSTGGSPSTEGGAQGLTALGTFSSQGTGAWSSNDLIPMKDASGNIALIDLNGLTTIRLTATSTADMDFLLFYNTTGSTGGGDGAHLTVTVNADKSLKITWDKPGTLQKTSTLLNAGTVWTDVSATSPQNVTIPAGAGAAFYRVKQ